MGVSDEVAVIATSAAASAVSSSPRSCAGCTEALGDVDRARLRAIRDGDSHDPATLGRLQRLQPDATRADDEKAPVAEIAQRPFCERESHRARGRRIRADRGLGAGPPASGDRGTEEQRETRPDRSLRRPRLERVADLAEDLRLAQDEGVEPGGDAAQMAGDVLARVHVEVVEKELARDGVRGRQSIDELVARILDSGRQLRVELDAVARLQNRVLENGGTALGTRARARRCARAVRRERCDG